MTPIRIKKVLKNKNRTSFYYKLELPPQETGCLCGCDIGGQTGRTHTQHYKRHSHAKHPPPIKPKQILPVPHQYGAEDTGGEADDEPFHPGAVVERGAVQDLHNNNQRMSRGQDRQAHQDLSLP